LINIKIRIVVKNKPIVLIAPNVGKINFPLTRLEIRLLKKPNRKTLTEKKIKT